MMAIHPPRELLELPTGSNRSDIILHGIHFNRAVIERWGYQLYSNGTISNDSSCILTDPPYTPVDLWPNGTFINVTSCFSPINPIGPRARTGVAFASVFGICLVLILVNLRRHGKLYLPAEKRFWPIGRRWQWYWGLFVCAAAFISLITNVDVDRYYLPELPIVLNVFFWFLMQMGTMACVWEAVRHWGSWMERQYIDPNPFALRQDDRRGKTEFWVPLVFYLWLWMNFFMVIPRNWEPLQLQRSPEQTADKAVPAATDIRFKIGAFFLFASWLTVVFSLRHSIKHYQPRNRGLMNRILGFARFTPLRFLLLLPLALALVAYQALCAFIFTWSPLNIHGSNLPIFLGGYAPSLLILIIQIASGFLSPNEDKELIRQRRVRGIEHDRELGLVRKPAWWRRSNTAGGSGPPAERMRDRIARNVRELGGGWATARNIDRAIETRSREAEAGGTNTGEAVEMGEMKSTTTTTTNQPADGAAAQQRPGAAPYGGKSDRRRSERTMQAAAGMLFPGAEAGGASVDRRAYLTTEGPPPPPYPDRGRTRAGAGVSDTLRPPTTERSTSTGTAPSITGQPQQIRSMLDV